MNMTNMKATATKIVAVLAVVETEFALTGLADKFSTLLLLGILPLLGTLRSKVPKFARREVDNLSDYVTDLETALRDQTQKRESNEHVVDHF